MKVNFLRDLGLSFNARENVLNMFKIRFFPIKNLGKISTREPPLEPIKQQKSKLKLQLVIVNQITANEKDLFEVV